MEEVRDEVVSRSPASRFDLLVIGGGPAGCSAAITGARRGVRVLLVERGRLPRQRVCGEFVSGESLALLAELLLDDAPGLLAHAPRIPRARLFVDGHTISAAVDPPAASIARFDLDACLWEAAASSGADCRLQTTVERIHGTGPFRISTSAGEFEAQAVIDASGRWSNLTRTPKTSPNGAAKWLGVKAHFAEVAAPNSVDLYFFDGGYCGIQPVVLASEARVDAGRDTTTRINACAMVRADVASALPEVFAQHPELAARSRHWQPLSEPVTTSPLLFGKPQLVSDGILFAGDSAGFVDPFVGDGISLALRSGALAAQCVLPFLRGECSRVDAEARYEHDYRTRLLPVFRRSSKLRHLFRLPRPLRSCIAHLLSNTPALTSYLVSKTR